MISKSSKLTKAAVFLSVAGALGACASQGPTDDPIKRKLTWLSYLDGGDIRRSCAAGGADQYRLVYNGIYTEQVRTYDLSASGRLAVRVIGPADLTRWSVSKLSDVLNPWRGHEASIALSPVAQTRLMAALKHDGAFGEPAVGTELSSRGFFWTIASCHQGQYRLTGLAWPSPAWDRATFDNVIFDLDPIDIRVNPPRRTDTGRDKTRGMHKVQDNEFHSKIGENGLSGLFTLDP